MGWMSEVVDFGADLFDNTSEVIGSAWDWATGSEAGMGAISGVGKGVLSYMAQQDAPDSDKAYAERIAAHNKGISEAAARYKVPQIQKLGG